MIAPIEALITALGVMAAFVGGLALAEVVERLLRRRGN